MVGKSRSVQLNFFLITFILIIFNTPSLEYTYARTHTHTHTHSHTLTHACMRTHAHSHTLTNACMRTHAKNLTAVSIVIFRLHTDQLFTPTS